MFFPFNQPDKTRDCGYRCAYYILNLFNLHDGQPYQEWIQRFRYFNPVESGITFTDITTVLNYHNVDFVFSHLTDKGIYLIYSGYWLHHEGKKHGHYFVYHDGKVYCSLRNVPYEMELSEVLRRLEAKTVDHSYRVLKILGKK